MAADSGLFRSVNAGSSWVQVSPQTFGYAADISFASSNPQRLYLRSWDIYRSDNGGLTWRRMSAPPSPVCGLMIAPADANHLYARPCSDDSGAVIFASLDGGMSWSNPSPSAELFLDKVVVSPQDPLTLIGADFDQVFRSADGGKTWSKVPIANRYLGTLIFDPLPPHTLYFGHWTGMLRSQDGGLTWQDSGLDRQFSVLMPSPYQSGEVLGGDDSASWRIFSQGNEWEAANWDAPQPLRSIWRSAYDASVLYAATQDQLWRYTSRNLSVQASLFIPVVFKGNQSGEIPLAAQQAVEKINQYRDQVGVIPIQLHPSIVGAAQSHANYYLLNHRDSSAWTYGAHGEVQGKPGYTGQWPYHRISAAGFPWWGGSEVLHFIGDPVDSVEGWMSTVYHRIVILDPYAHYAGYGHGESKEAAIDVMNFASGPMPSGLWFSALPYPLAYPADGQTGVPISWNGSETPNPLPSGASRPVGYPFTLQGVGGTLQVSYSEMRGSDGKLIPIHPNPTDCDTYNCFTLIAKGPLQENSRYTVRVVGKVGDVAFDRTWAFTTGGKNQAGFSEGGDVDGLGPVFIQPSD